MLLKASFAQDPGSRRRALMTNVFVEPSPSSALPFLIVGLPKVLPIISSRKNACRFGRLFLCLPYTNLQRYEDDLSSLFGVMLLSDCYLDWGPMPMLLLSSILFYAVQSAYQCDVQIARIMG